MMIIIILNCFLYMIIVIVDGQFGFQDPQQPKGQPCRTKLFMPKPLRRAEPS